MRSQAAPTRRPSASVISETTLSIPCATSKACMGRASWPTRLPNNREITSPPGQKSGSQPVHTSIRQEAVCS